MHFLGYSKADFVSRVKYNNNLPDIPFDAKFITYPFESNRLVLLGTRKLINVPLLHRNSYWG